MALHPPSPRTLIDRRRFLRSAALALPATAALSSTAGCLTRVGLAKNAYLQLLAVTVSWQHDGTRYQDQVLQATSDGASEIRVRMAAEHADDFGASLDSSVGDALHEHLERRFEVVTYLAGFCWQADGSQPCRNARVDRGDFNELAFGDRAEIRPQDDHIDVLDIYPGAQGDADDWAVEVIEFDFEELHADHGVPPA